MGVKKMGERVCWGVPQNKINFKFSIKNRGLLDSFPDFFELIFPGSSQVW